jgi:hypothetical protein
MARTRLDRDIHIHAVYNYFLFPMSLKLNKYIQIVKFKKKPGQFLLFPILCT